MPDSNAIEYLKAQGLIEASQRKFSPELMALYNSAQWRYVIRHQVFERDGYRCCNCGCKASKGNWLECDHVRYMPRNSSLKELMAQPLSDFQTLCHKCHKQKTKESRRKK